MHTRRTPNRRGAPRIHSRGRQAGVPDIPPTTTIPVQHHRRHVAAAAAGAGGPAATIVAGRSAGDGAVAVEVAAVGGAGSMVVVALGRVERFFGGAELGCRGLFLAPLLGQLPHDVRDFFVVFLEHVGEVGMLGTLDVAIFLAELALAAGVPRRMAVGDVNVRGLKRIRNRCAIWKPKNLHCNTNRRYSHP